ncbi:MAG: Ig-like domain-containing protein [Treponema sp.]|jgi:hypothetical protein|nr:Ig-like domain-containing protein [Treponema sp.]
MKSGKLKAASFAIGTFGIILGLVASCEDGSSDNETSTVKVTGVTLNETEKTINVGDEPFNLTAAVAPENAGNKAVTWSLSGDEGVVQLSATSGGTITVTGLTAGTATITATTADGGFTASCEVTVNPAIPQDALVKFNAKDELVYDGASAITAFGKTGNEAYLLYPAKLDILTDSISIKAKVKPITTSGHNGTGFISVNGSARKGYMLNTAQNVKNVGTTNGLGGQGLEGWQNGATAWEAGRTYVFKSELIGGVINHYIYDEDGTTLLNQKTGTSITAGHAETDVVYAAIGGTNVNNMEWSEIQVIYNGITYNINSLEPQSALPVLSIESSSVRVPLNEQGTMAYTATAPGGGAVAVTAVSSDQTAVKVDSADGGIITFTALAVGTTEITITNTAALYLTAAFAVTVTNFPDADDYGALTAYPAAGATAAYTDGELMLTFDGVPQLLEGGSICIYDKATGEPVDVVLFKDEKQVTLGSSNNNLNVGSQLARVDGNSVYWMPHFNALANSTEYYIAIPDGAISGALNGKPFVGLSDNKEIATWSFTTKAAPSVSAGTPITVDGSQASTADFRTVYGALKAIASQNGNFTINVAPGTYTELVHYVGTANVTINGTGSGVYGNDVIIQYTNSEKVNTGTHARASFYFSGANLVLKNLTLKNTSARISGYDPGQAEAIYFANGTGKTFAAYNCSFLSHQDTIQTTGKNWFYRCYIEGDTDYIWGTAEACLVEESQLVSVNDTNKTNNKDAILFVARTATKTATAIPKGYVLFNSRVTTQNGMTTYFGRNAGAGDFYDQVAIVDSEFTNEDTGRIGATLWSGTTYDFLAGFPQHVGAKYHNVTVKDGTFSDDGALANVVPIENYALEYNGRRAVLNRVYRTDLNAYAPAGSAWDVTALEAAFNASVDPSANNDYGSAADEASTKLTERRE